MCRIRFAGKFYGRNLYIETSRRVAKISLFIVIIKMNNFPILFFDLLVLHILVVGRRRAHVSGVIVCRKGRRRSHHSSRGRAIALVPRRRLSWPLRWSNRNLGERSGEEPAGCSSSHWWSVGHL